MSFFSTVNPNKLTYFLSYLNSSQHVSFHFILLEYSVNKGLTQDDRDLSLLENGIRSNINMSTVRTHRTPHTIGDPKGIRDALAYGVRRPVVSWNRRSLPDEFRYEMQSYVYSENDWNNDPQLLAVIESALFQKLLLARGPNTRVFRFCSQHYINFSLETGSGNATLARQTGVRSMYLLSLSIHRQEKLGMFCLYLNFQIIFCFFFFLIFF